MADVTPNYELESLKIELQIAEFELSLKRIAVRKAELADELGRIAANETVTYRAIEEQKQRLSRMPRKRETIEE